MVDAPAGGQIGAGCAVNATNDCKLSETILAATSWTLCFTMRYFQREVGAT
jgi:hypothetical protein